MVSQNQVLLVVAAVLVVAGVYYFMIYKPAQEAAATKKDGYMGRWDGYNRKRRDYYNGDNGAITDMTAEAAASLAMPGAGSSASVSDLTPVAVDESAVGVPAEPASANSADLLTYFESQYPDNEVPAEVVARQTQKAKFKANVRAISQQVTVDDHPDLALQNQVEGVDIKDVGTYDNNAMVPMSYVSKKLYDGFNTSVGARQVYPLENDMVKVSNFGFY